mmetsp:Transcript_12248/g.35536  ORF Transcript_12248/g.35536 Transcript_12248/m.35536 type:complete len:1610 (-) Transcript_12248:86-4915(-)|eukprot:CAMPEP_0119549160 /NCGR_PEP_ID=MMETSP1352-20130426/2927_1 /TAXON_ID=265584 /ORGANISM="Stauroneis constricta, Strain CCMP1120" /LENGTH=1609 /DNA_ID=CAMNT_0007594649 /DNA_START=111 /DNA_END=4940 /DNA_ORIENTATION=-
MPLHIPALAAAAAGYMTAQDCVRADDVSITDDENPGDIIKFHDYGDDENDVEINPYTSNDTDNDGRNQNRGGQTRRDSSSANKAMHQTLSDITPQAGKRESRRSVRFTSNNNINGMDDSAISTNARKRGKLESINPRVDAAIDESIRSMLYSEQSSRRSMGSQRQHQMIVQLKSVSASFDQDGAAAAAQPNLTAPGMVYEDSLLSGFCNGDFASGKVNNIRLKADSSCWVIAYNNSSSVLAVGLEDRVDFLETKNYTVMHSIPFSGNVSGIKWYGAEVLDGGSLVAPAVSSTSWKDSKRSLYDINRGELVAVCGLNGQVNVYHVYIPLLELRGATPLHSFHVAGEVRSMVMQYMPKHDVLIVAVGDTTGKITLSTMTKDVGSVFLKETNKVVEDKGLNNSILSLAIHSSETTDFLVSTCKDGTVAVDELFHHVPSSILDGLSMKDHTAGFISFGESIWCTQRNGPIRACVVFQDGSHLAFGGYDKTLVIVDIDLWAVVREMPLQGTINHVSFDRLNRYMVVGCRDKSITMFDTSTYVAIKRWETSGWVTCITWSNPGLFSDVMAVRSESKAISLIDLTPVHSTDAELSHEEGSDGCSTTWSPDGHYLARIDGNRIVVVDSRFGFSQVAECDALGASQLRQIQFSPILLKKYDDACQSQPSASNSEQPGNANANSNNDGDSHDEPLNDVLMLAAVGTNGYLQLLELKYDDNAVNFEIIQAQFVEANLWTVQWSNDAKLIFVGGKEGNLHAFSSDKLRHHGEPVAINDRIWDIEAMQVPLLQISQNKKSPPSSPPSQSSHPLIAVASGDYKAVLYDGETLEPMLQVMRPRAVRCLGSHPKQPLLAIGDSAGMVAVVDYHMEETIFEFEVGGRVNSLDFSPVGDFLLIGTDDCIFLLCETKTYNTVQVFERGSFATSGQFSSNGKYMSLGSASDPYSIVRMGPFLGIDHVPLSDEDMLSQLPSWALKETLHRSGFGPSLIQRQMLIGSHKSLQWVASSLKDHPDAIHTIDRSQNEGCFDTAIRLRKIKLLKLALTTMVDGSMESNMDGRRSILTSNVPKIGMVALQTMLNNYPSELVVEILREIRFVKVPFTTAHAISDERRQLICGSDSYLDPWVTKPSIAKPEPIADYSKLNRTPAVLPLPGLGSFEFLSIMILKAPAIAFDNEAMGLVLKVLWRYHIRRYFIVDTLIFALYYSLWVVLVDITTSSTQYLSSTISHQLVAGVLLAINTLFVMKECLQSNFGRRPGYFSSLWNTVDILSCIMVYSFTMMVITQSDFNDGTVPVAVVTSLLLTMKLLSYLRAFHDTGWLVAVLNQNFNDVRGFLVVLLAIIIGFSTAFRLVFGSYEPDCEVQLESDANGDQTLAEDCDDSPFGSLRRSFLSTFELTILGSYDPQLLYQNDNKTLAALMFVLAVTCVLVVALNALISVLADSYARVQENATANRRKERAELIVEYMTLLPAWRVRQIEKSTRYFHALLEADADGDLVLETDDWRGGLNALRDDIQEMNESNLETTRQALEEMRMDIDREISNFRKEVSSALRDIAVDVRKIQKLQRVDPLVVSGRRAVKAVKQIGSKIGRKRSGGGDGSPANRWNKVLNQAQQRQQPKRNKKK